MIQKAEFYRFLRYSIVGVSTFSIDMALLYVGVEWVLNRLSYRCSVLFFVWYLTQLHSVTHACFSRNKADSLNWVCTGDDRGACRCTYYVTRTVVCSIDVWYTVPHRSRACCRFRRYRYVHP
jgi:hypothetical protein